MQHWILLATAIVLEVAGTTSMKLSDGLSRLMPSVLVFVFYAVSFVAFSIALKRIEVSVAYAIWAGIGTAAIAIIGILYFRESVTTSKLLSIVLIVASVVGLNLGDVRH